jgi:hypothetical protein
VLQAVFLYVIIYGQLGCQTAWFISETVCNNLLSIGILFDSREALMDAWFSINMDANLFSV